MRNARPFSRPEAGAERQVESIEHERAEPRRRRGPSGIITVVTTGLRSSSRSHRISRPHARTAARVAAASRRCRANTLRAALPRRSIAQRFAQAVRAGSSTACTGRTRRVGGEHRLPRPVRLRQASRELRRGERLRADRVEAQAGRQHQPLLRSRERDVDAPLVVAEIDRAERRHRVDEQQRRMPRAIDRAADLGKPAGRAGRRLVVHDEHGLDAMLAVVARAAPRASPGSTPRRPVGAGTTSTSSPSRRATSAQSRANSPISNASTLSPGDSVLTSAASQAPVPDDG